MSQRVTDFIDKLSSFRLEVSSQELLKVFKAFLVNDGSRCLELSALVFGLFLFGLHTVSILGNNIGGQETREVAMLYLSLRFLMSILWAQIKLIGASVSPPLNP